MTSGGHPRTHRRTDVSEGSPDNHTSWPLAPGRSVPLVVAGSGLIPRSSVGNVPGQGRFAGSPDAPAAPPDLRSRHTPPVGSRSTMGLQQFEQRLERMVEGAFSKALRGGLQPVEIARRLTREMDLLRRVGVKGLISPNDFT